ncbi:MAG: hypothetical protein ACRD15_00050, partial [Vicinamibacterales bacterium]
VDQGATDEVFSISSAMSRVAGRHNLRFGVRAQYRELFMNTPVNPQGAFDFNGRATGAANSRPHAVADFLLGYCSTCRGQYGTMDSNYRSPTVALFVDDVWQMSDRLTLQAGLRWEYLAPWHEMERQRTAEFPPRLSARSGLHGQRRAKAVEAFQHESAERRDGPAR